MLRWPSTISGTTDDLDLFTTSASAFERARHVIPAVADELGTRVEVRQDAPGFRRYALTRADSTVIVDAVHERAPQRVVDKPRVGDVVVDPPDEILANKLTAVVGCMEERDLVDLLFLVPNVKGEWIHPIHPDAATPEEVVELAHQLPFGRDHLRAHKTIGFRAAPSSAR